MRDAELSESNSRVHACNPSAEPPPINEFAGGVLPDAETWALGPCAFLPPAHNRVVSTPVKTAQTMMVPKSVVFGSVMPSGIVFQDLVSDIFELSE